MNNNEDTSLTPPDPFRGRGKIMQQTTGFLCSERKLSGFIA